jgi:hypothetical protein
MSSSEEVVPNSRPTDAFYLARVYIYMIVLLYIITNIYLRLLFALNIYEDN